MLAVCALSGAALSFAFARSQGFSDKLTPVNAHGWRVSPLDAVALRGARDFAPHVSERDLLPYLSEYRVEFAPCTQGWEARIPFCCGAYTAMASSKLEAALRVLLLRTEGPSVHPM